MHRTYEVPRELEQVLKTLSLGKLLPTLPERLRQATERNLNPVDTLLLILSDEVQRRERERIITKAQRAKLNSNMLLDEWDHSAEVDYDHRLFDNLQTLRFIEQKHHLLLMGPVGVGKTMIAQGLGHIAVRRGFSVICETADKLLLKLKGSRLDDTHLSMMRRLIQVNLLIIDDFALRIMDEIETMDIYEIITARHQTGSIIITSNRSPDEWLSQLADPLHGQALVDRFSNNAYDFIINGESYRKRQKPHFF